MHFAGITLTSRKAPAKLASPIGITMPEYYPEMRKLNHFKVSKMRKSILQSPVSPYTEILAKRIEASSQKTLHSNTCSKDFD